MLFNKTKTLVFLFTIFISSFTFSQSTPNTGLADTPCDAYNNYSSYNINYTDDGDDAFGSGDTISSSDTESTFDYGSDYYYNDTASVFKVTFSSDGTGGYNITVNSSLEDTASCSSVGGGSGTSPVAYLDNTPCDAYNNYSSYNINYTDDGDDAFGSGDTISSSDTESTFDYGSDYYYNDTASVFKVTFSSDGTGGYNITVNSSLEDTASCSSVGGGSGTSPVAYLDNTPCDAYNNYSSYNINYTDDGDDAFGSGDTISSSDTESTFDYGSDYYYNDTASVFKVTFSSDGTGGYNITVNSSLEDTASCSSVGGGSGTSPEFDETPSTSSVAQTKFTLNADINEEGIIYYVVVADGALAPSSSEVKAGTGNGGTGELASGNATVDSGDYIYEFSVSGLTGGTDYDVYLVAEDNEAIPNLQAIPEKLDVTTAELISLTISGILGGDKAYDGTTAATATGTATLNGVESGDDVSLGGSPVFTFASANVGTGITITTSGYTISGTDSGNYTLTQPTLSGDITAKELTISGILGGDKAYDGTTAATATGTATLNGVESGDDVSLGGSPVFTFASANVGTGITITTSGYTISGTDSGNYTLTQPTLSGDITAKELTITGISGGDKAYDGTTAATATGTATLNGVESGDDVSLGGSPVFTFASANVGTGITITTSGYTISGTDSGNYTLTQPTLSGDITAKELTITGISGGDKAYDGTTAATATGTATLNGVESGDDVSLGGSPVFTFASANVGTGITITTSGYTISGTDSGNYTLTQPTLSGDITAKELTITADADTKVYGATDPTLTYSITGFVNGDTEADLDTGVSISRAAGENVDTYTITPSAAADSNYTVSFVPADFTITAAALTVTADADTKVYGATDPTLTYSITGFVNGDTEADLDTGVSISRAAGENVDTYTITPSAAADSNYTVSFVPADFTITAADLTVTADADTKVYGATDPTLTYSITGFVNGDTEADLDTGVSISRAAGENVDTYTITPSAAADSNYTVSFVTADFTITAAALTVTASDQTKVYGVTDPTLTYSITGFVNGDTEADLDTGVSISRAAGENVDTYTITPSAAADSNYTVSFVTADFTITAADLTVTASDQTKVYGGNRSNTYLLHLQDL